MRNPSYFKMVELTRKSTENLRRAIGRHVIGDEEAIAEIGDVEERLADETILVSDQ
jgi:hypothetical protein